MISRPGTPVNQSASKPGAIEALRAADSGMTIGELAYRAGVTAAHCDIAAGGCRGKTGAAHRAAR